MNGKLWGYIGEEAQKILPGVRINWSKSGPSVSVGPHGAKVIKETHTFLGGYQRQGCIL